MLFLAISLGLLSYAFFVYPAILFLWARRHPAPGSGAYEPRVSILVPVYNEENVIRDKVKNCLELDYPPDKLEIVFVSDGSTDRSVEWLRQDGSGRISVRDHAVNRGKTAVLNETIPQLRGEVVVLTDASGLLNREAIRALAGHFRDPSIGCVCGIYHVLKKDSSPFDASEGSYHGLEMKLREWEGRIRTTLSGTGSLCAFRKSAFEPLPPDLINEDFVLPARLAMQGWRVIYEPGARVYDKVSTRWRQVFRRRVRIAYGNWQQLAYLKPLLNPANGFLAWVFYSHKLIRMILPFLLVAMLGVALIVAPMWAGALAAVGVVALIAAGLSLWADKLFSRRNPLGFVVVFFINCLAVWIGTAHYLAKRKVRW